MNAVKLGKSIRAIRQMRGISQAQVADKTGLNPNYISRLENGDRNGTLVTIEKIASVLGVNYAVLLLFSEMDKPELQEFAPLVFKNIWQPEVRLALHSIESDGITFTWEG